MFNKHQKMKTFAMITTDNITIDEKFYTETPEEAAEAAFQFITKQIIKSEMNDIIDFKLIDDEPIRTIYFFVSDPLTNKVVRLHFVEFIRILAKKQNRINNKIEISNY